MINCRTVMLLVALGLVVGCSSRSAQKYLVLTSHGVTIMDPDPAGSHLPIFLYFCVGNSRSVEIDSHGVITLQVLGNQSYGKISGRQREQLDDLLLSDTYSDALLQLTPGTGGLLSCYGDPYALLTHSSRHQSYMIQLLEMKSVPERVLALFALVDEIGQTTFGALYRPVVPDVGGATPNKQLKLTVTSLACARAAALG